MERIRERAKALAPTLTLTLLSIVQALALEVLWNSTLEHTPLWEGGLSAVIGWLQVAAAISGIIVLWVAYAGLVVRFVWMPSLHESVVPFLLGIAQFILATQLGAAWLGYWILVMAALFVFATWNNARIFRAAMADPENSEHLVVFPYRSIDFWRPLAIFVAVFLLGAALVFTFGALSWAGVAALLGVHVCLIWQFHVIRFYWNRSLFD